MDSKYLSKKTGMIMEPTAKLANDQDYVMEYLDLHPSRSYSISFSIPGIPEAYVRERATRFSSNKKVRFYNAKQQIMADDRKIIGRQLTSEDRKALSEMLPKAGDPKTGASVSIIATYFLPMPKSMSIKERLLAEAGMLFPSGRPDLDNYDKFLLDTLHDVIYDDDSIVTSIKSVKRYCLEGGNPRTEVLITAERASI